MYRLRQSIRPALAGFLRFTESNLAVFTVPPQDSTGAVRSGSGPPGRWTEHYEMASFGSDGTSARSQARGRQSWLPTAPHGSVR